MRTKNLEECIDALKVLTALDADLTTLVNTLTAASKSIPVVIATDQTAIPVEEQNKVQSEVALSLLGIPRAEVALGIFADVNTYDVNPSEWSSSPQYYVTGDIGGHDSIYDDYVVRDAWMHDVLRDPPTIYS